MIWLRGQIVIRKKFLAGHLIAHNYLFLFLLAEKSGTGS